MRNSSGSTSSVANSSNNGRPVTTEEHMSANIERRVNFRNDSLGSSFMTSHSGKKMPCPTLDYYDHRPTQNTRLGFGGS